jgi:hypothetical protein
MLCVRRLRSSSHTPDKPAYLNWRVCQTCRSWRRGAGRPKAVIPLPTHTAHLTDRVPPTPGASGHDDASDEKLLRSAGVGGCLVRPAEAAQPV